MNALTPSEYQLRYPTAAKMGFSLDDMRDPHFYTLDDYTAGMSHPARIEFLANELNLYGDDEQLTRSKALAWDIITAWEDSKGGRNLHAHPAFRDALNTFAGAK